MNRLLIRRWKSKSVYEIFNVRSSIKPADLTKLIESSSENLPLSLNDRQEIKTYLRDPVRYQLENELKIKKSNTSESELSFFGPKTNTAISKLPNSSQQHIKNSTAHLSFRSGAYILIIVVYCIMRSTMITQEERDRLCQGLCVW